MIASTLARVLLQPEFLAHRNSDRDRYFRRGETGAPPEADLEHRTELFLPSPLPPREVIAGGRPAACDGCSSAPVSDAVT